MLCSRRKEKIITSKAATKSEPPVEPTSLHVETFILLQRELADNVHCLFMFVEHPEVEPTNNRSECNARREAEIRKGAQHADRTWHPLLADFGIGAIADRSLLEQQGIAAAGSTQTLLEVGSSRTGTRLYQPPEASVGRPATIQGDVYALGVSLYQLLLGAFSKPIGMGWERDFHRSAGVVVGSEPISAAGAKNLQSPSDRENLPTPNSTLESTSPELLELLQADIAECVDHDPARRLAGAALLAERLSTLDQRITTLQARRRAARQAVHQRRLRQALAVVVVALVIVGGLGLFAYLQWQRKDEDAAAADRSRKESRKNEQTALDLSKTKVQRQIKCASRIGAVLWVSM